MEWLFDATKTGNSAYTMYIAIRKLAVWIWTGPLFEAREIHCRAINRTIELDSNAQLASSQTSVHFAERRWFGKFARVFLGSDRDPEGRSEKKNERGRKIFTRLTDGGRDDAICRFCWVGNVGVMWVSEVGGLGWTDRRNEWRIQNWTDASRSRPFLHWFTRLFAQHVEW